MSSVPEKELINYGIGTWLWIGVISGWGGVASYIRKLRNGMVARFSLAELIGEVVVSGFVGVVTFLICQSSGIDQLLTAAFTGICAHMGSRAIFFFELAIDSSIKHWLSKSAPLKDINDE